MADDGSWYAQYTTADYTVSDQMPSTFYITWPYDMSPVDTISWMGSYSYP